MPEGAALTTRKNELRQEAISTVSRIRIGLNLPVAQVEATATVVCLRYLEHIDTWVSPAMLSFYRTLHEMQYLVIRRNSAVEHNSMSRLISGTKHGEPRAPFTGMILAIWPQGGPNGQDLIRPYNAHDWQKAVSDLGEDDEEHDELD